MTHSCVFFLFNDDRAFTFSIPMCPVMAQGYKVCLYARLLTDSICTGGKKSLFTFIFYFFDLVSMQRVALSFATEHAMPPELPRNVGYGVQDTA